MRNEEVAKVFDEIADLLEVQEENPFRIRAYRRAASLLRALGEPVEEIEDLTRLPGIGKDLAAKIRTVLERGDLPLRQELARQVPPGVLAMIRLPNIGPKRAKTIHKALKINTREELIQACEEHRLAALPGFGKTLEERILTSLRELPREPARLLLSEAEREADRLLHALQQVPGLVRVEVAGSFRRRLETVGDLDLLAVTKDPEALVKAFLAYPGAGQVLAHGERGARIRLHSGLQVDLRLFNAEEYGAALHYFTGSKTHNIAVRTLGKKFGLKINEYGVFRGEQRVGGAREQDVFDAVGLPWIPPELREGGRELEAEIPTLVNLEDLRGDLHLHTDATDGHHSLEEMVAAAKERGYEYIAITDHSRSVRIAGGLTEEQMTRHWKRIEALAAPIRVFKGVELDILADGSLDYPDDVLAGADWVIAAVHFRHRQTPAELTKRMVRAIESGRVHAVAHPTGRLINKRPAMEFDFETVLEACRKHRVALEIDGQPDRQDLTCELADRARSRGVKLVLDSDAHAVWEMSFVKYAVYQARRGWCTRDDVLNCLPLQEFEAWLSGAARAQG